MHSFPARLLGLSLAVLAADHAIGQSNVVPGRDIRLENTFGLADYRRTGTFPNGVQAFGTWTVCCNPGTSSIPFLAAMQPHHGFIHYIIARESDGRLVQISNYAWVKHTFGSSNDPSTCGTCVNGTTSSYVEVGCNDTYANYQSVDHYNLGPPDEIDPWLGYWDPICSHFDRGNPPVVPSQQCDGIRSLTHTQANALNTAINDAMRVYDDDLNVPGATFWYQSGYIVPGEAEALRDDNIGSRQFTANWSANQWFINDGNNFANGSILNRWSGATVTSNSNGNDDGRYYVAVKVTGPTNGLYHYEYAVHNRDANRGMGAFRIPVCPEAQVSNFGFHDFDRDPLSDWTGSKVGSEIVFQMPAVGGGPLRWNSIYNFWFDSDAAPTSGSVQLDQHDIGPGALSVGVSTTTPSGVYNQFLGAGCGIPNAPSLYATGTPDRAQIPNPTFALQSGNNVPGSICAFLLSSSPGATVIAPGCTAFTGDPLTMLGPILDTASATGFANVAVPVPNNPALEGSELDFQMVAVVPGGSFLGTFNLSNGLRVRVGNVITSCP